MSSADENTGKGFPLPAVDKSNLRYQRVVKQLNNRALASRHDIDPKSTTVYRTLSRLLKSKTQQATGKNIKALGLEKGALKR